MKKEYRIAIDLHSISTGEYDSTCYCKVEDLLRELKAISRYEGLVATKTYLTDPVGRLIEGW